MILVRLLKRSKICKDRYFPFDVDLLINLDLLTSIREKLGEYGFCCRRWRRMWRGGKYGWWRRKFCNFERRFDSLAINDIVRTVYNCDMFSKERTPTFIWLQILKESSNSIYLNVELVSFLYFRVKKVILWLKDQEIAKENFSRTETLWVM